MKTILYMTRHGETEWNKIGRMQGQLNSNLTELGKNQARWLGERLADTKIDVIISSTSQRAIDTAELIRGDRAIDIIQLEALKEMHFGLWQGMSHVDVKANYPEASEMLWYQPQNYIPIEGESFEALRSRLVECIEMIIKTYEKKSILVVAHGIVLKSLIAYFENKPLERFWEGAYMHSTCLNLLEINGSDRKFIYQGDISHHKE